MQLITNDYRKLNENLHNKVLTYGTSGHKYSDQVIKICHRLNTKDVLDYGCGKCTLANTIPFTIKKYDPAIRAFHADPEPADVVVCTDVMEHIEPECLDAVLSHMQSKTKKVLYMVICTREAKKTLEDGRNAHILLKDSCAWFNKISEFFDIYTFMKNGDSVEITAGLKKQEETK